MATIADVAEAAGVSRSTVSYALSGKRPISDEVRQRVLAAVDELGYTPNAGARALASAQTHVIGVLAEFYADEFAPAMLQYILGISRTAQELGYDILLVTAEDGAAALNRVASSQMIDGAVLLNVSADDHRLPVIRSISQPVVLVGLPDDPTGVDVFDLDFEESGRMMVDTMASAGRDRVLLISQPEHVVVRGGAYVWRLRDAAVEQARVRKLDLRCYHAASIQPAVGEDLRRLLDENPDADGILLNNEAAAAALPGILAERGVRVPEDMAVIGRYNDEFARTFSLPFSYIDSAAEQLGRMAVHRLVQRMSGKNATVPSVHLVAPRYIDRPGSV